MLKANWCRYTLAFRFVARTSRETMRTKDTYFVKVFDTAAPGTFGIGECALFKGLSADDVPEFETEMQRACDAPDAPLPAMSAIRFGFETALADLYNGGRRVICNNDWINGQASIPINGLIWMGDKETMLRRVEEKIEGGFRVLKLKIGGIAFEDELSIISAIRKHFSRDVLELRLDANGSFTADNAMKRLDKLSVFGIHSIEQPVKAGQVSLMRSICSTSPIPVGLDEELIGCRSMSEMDSLISEIRPSYIIIKPSLCGGLAAADQWIEAARRNGIGWWATSALESNIGLNAIAQWLSSKHPSMPQGLGTGELYENNIPSPLRMVKDRLTYSPSGKWILPELPWLR